MSKLQDTSWEAGWDGHQKQQLRRLARAPLADKLRWLEGAHRLVRQLQPATRTEKEDEEARVRE